MSFWQKIFPSKRQLPPFALQYLQNCRSKNDKRSLIPQIRFVVLDTETNGLDPAKTKLLSLGAVVVQDTSILPSQSLEFTAYAPAAAVSEQVAIHGITRRELQEGLKEEMILQHLLQFMDSAVLVAHHAAFDLAVLNRLCQTHFGFKLKNPVLDTAHLAKRLEHGTQLDEYIRPEDYSLDQLCERYSIRPDDRHTAAGDAYITAQLLLKLLAKARKSGIRTYGDLMR
jgi:DNA polymerase-3 subunit epsilon